SNATLCSSFHVVRRGVRRREAVASPRFDKCGTFSVVSDVAKTSCSPVGSLPCCSVDSSTSPLPLSGQRKLDRRRTQFFLAYEVANKGRRSRLHCHPSSKRTNLDHQARRLSGISSVDEGDYEA